MPEATLFGVGVGPGDPELMTLRAVRAIQEAPVVAFFAKRGGAGRARTIARRFVNPSAELLALYYPYTIELSRHSDEYVSALKRFYDDAAKTVSSRLKTGCDVAVLCEGDPLLYGSYIYLHDRLSSRHPTVVVPGIASYAGCAATAGIPLVSTDRALVIVPGTLDEAELERRLRQADAAVVIKLGRNLPKVRRVLERLGRADLATYCERGTTPEQVVMPLKHKRDDDCAYFSLLLIPGHRPDVARPSEQRVNP